MTLPQAVDPPRPHIIETPVAERPSKLCGSPLAWSPPFRLLDRRFQEPLDITLFHGTPGECDTVFG